MKLEEKAKKLVLENAIDMKKEFVLRKGNIYLLLREERKEVDGFILEQLKKRYIKPLKSLQTVSVFFVEKRIVRRGWFRTISI